MNGGGPLRPANVTANGICTVLEWTQNDDGNDDDGEDSSDQSRLMWATGDGSLRNGPISWFAHNNASRTTERRLLSVYRAGTRIGSIICIIIIRRGSGDGASTVVTKPTQQRAWRPRALIKSRLDTLLEKWPNKSMS